MKILFTILLLLSVQASALSMGPPVDGTQGQLAAQHYQPFTGLKFYTLMGWVGCLAATQEWRDVNGERESVYGGVNVSGVVGGLGLLLTSFGGGHYTNKTDTPFSRDQIDPVEYERRRTGFITFYSVAAVSEVVMLTSSGATNRWWGLGAGLVGPFLLDQIFRPLFYGDRLSPFATPTFGVTADGTPVASFSATF